MVVGTGLITLRLHDCRSLKGKRKIVKSMINRLRNNFNASIAEVGSNDIYQKAEIGFSLSLQRLKPAVCEFLRRFDVDGSGIGEGN